MEIKNTYNVNGDLQYGKKEKLNRKYRELVCLIAKHPPRTIEVGEWDDQGDLTFGVDMKEDWGMTRGDIKQYENELFSYFMVDFLGELIIRENASYFIDKMKGYDAGQCISITEKYGSHKRFGVRTHRGQLIFRFHISLLKEILTDDLREVLG